MFEKISAFFIKNKQLTIVLVIVTMISGIGSYFILPKQYNPTIIVPAFNVFIEANGLKSEEISKYVVSPLENKLMEIEGIDEIYGESADNYGAVMLKFKVGEDLENAKIRLNQKLSENIGLAPLGINKPIVTTINPETLPQITIAISSKKTNLSTEKQLIYLRQIAGIIKENIKIVQNVTTIDLVGGFNSDIIIDLDLQEIESKNTDIMSVYNILQNNNLNMSVGNIDNKSSRVSVGVEGKVEKISDLKKLVIQKIGNKYIYLEDIAEIRLGTKKINKISTYDSKNTVFLGVGKQVGTNGVFLTDDVLNKIEKLKIQLPKNIEIEVIQNEGDTARKATNMLLLNLLQSVLIVFLVLAFYLGKKDAFNTAVSIPLTLGLVFLLALLMGENINRITLFALILVLGMLVDNSTVVVENISRHLKERFKIGKTKKQAVLEAVQEVGVGVVLSTISRLLAFGAMFAVGGMMGEYMGPIPKFAIMALVISLFIAFAINPWISYMWANDEIVEKKSFQLPLFILKLKSKYLDKYFKNRKINFNFNFDIRKYYLDFMKGYLNTEKQSIRKRKIFKIVFWLALFGVIIAPIYLGIFKARMLPKSNQNQIYLWIDAPRGWGIDKMNDVNNDVVDFFNKYNSEFISINKNNQELYIVDTISTTVGQAFMGDFANLFRGGLSRVGENQLSARINLISPDNFENLTGDSRLFSEAYTIRIREIFRNFILEKYPDLQVRLLEDPPGPPVRATFLAKIKSNASLENKGKFLQKVENEIKKISSEKEIVDLGNSLSTTYRKINVKLDNELVSRAGLTAKQISYTLAISLNSMDINLIGNSESIESTNLILGLKNDQNNSIEILKNIFFTNKNGKKIFLTSISDLEYNFVGNKINTDKREKVDYIYGEMGDNSLIYPVISLFGIFLDDEFIGTDYKLVNWSLYEIEYEGILDGKKYVIQWGGEWELTMDTFRDLGLAMMLSLLAIYFLLVGQFSSFRIAGIIMITFLLSFYGVFPGFTMLFLAKNEYFSATSMIGIIALGGIVVGNAIILIDYLNVLKRNGLTIIDALLKAGYVRFAPIILTSLTTVFGAATIIGDPVWSGLAWTIIWGLLVSSVLTLIVIPIFYYESQKDEWEKCAGKEKNEC